MRYGLCRVNSGQLRARINAFDFRDSEEDVGAGALGFGGDGGFLD